MGTVRPGGAAGATIRPTDQFAVTTPRAQQTLCWLPLELRGNEQTDDGERTPEHRAQPTKTPRPLSDPFFARPRIIIERARPEETICGKERE
jgi:hypothetical protein